ncbi:cation:proton antiporter [Halorussus sp. AFM4]|uniref:cation:proton antiporter n=1 Tax=Halorussus sp. AFM4 TaxID=3421651 RepID=UPI003EBE3CCD
MPASIESTLLDVLILFGIATGARILAAHIVEVSYTVILVLIGVAVSVSGFTLQIPITHDVILLVLLPTLLFQETLEVSLTELETHWPWILTLVVIVLPLSVVVVGWFVSTVLPVPLMIGLLFGAIIFPTDPVSAISLFEELNAPDQLEAIIEGETLLNDASAIVLFSTLSIVVGMTPSQPSLLPILVRKFVVLAGGGILVGLVTGGVMRYVVPYISERMATFLLTVVLAYGSFLLAHQLGGSGILATVTAGLLQRELTGEYGLIIGEDDGDPEFLLEAWSTVAFVVNTTLYILIGTKVRVAQWVDHAFFIVVAFGLVLAARAMILYPVITVGNWVFDDTIPLHYQHVIVWGSLHTILPIALVLSVQPSIRFYDLLRTVVFGIAILSTVVQGQSTPYVLRVTGTTKPTAEQSPET